jgi:cytoskeleton protein RodZ
MTGGDSMTDDAAAPIGTAGLDPATAGAMLRAAREKRGLHIAALAASIKVSPRKLEALEADRYAELPDLTFTRALAQTMCRALKIDAAQVLAKLPQAGDMPKLSQVGGGINAPFREVSTSRDPGEFTLHRKPVFWATLLILLGALALALLPERLMPWRAALRGPASTPAPASVTEPSTPPAAQPASSSPVIVAAGPAAAASESAPNEAAVVAPLPAAADSESTTGAPPPALTVRTNADSWIDVQDGHGQTLLSRNVRPGEDVGVDGTLPLRLTIGNAAATQLVFRGRPVSLASSTRDNVARLQLP